MLYDIPGTPLNKMNISQITHEACKEAEMYLNVGIVSRYIALKNGQEQLSNSMFDFKQHLG